MTAADPVSRPEPDSDDPALAPPRRRKSRALQLAEYALFRAIAWLASLASEETLLTWGSRLGTFASLVVRRRRNLALRNLAMIFPEKSEEERRRIAADCWRHFGRSALQYLRMPRLTHDEILSRCSFTGRENLDAAIAQGKGAIMISAHFGSWEYGGLVFMAIVDRVRTVTRVLDNEYLERDLARMREQTGAQVIDRRRAARPLMKALAERSTILLLPDQAALRREGVLAPFMGRPAWTTPAPAKLALRYETPIVIAFCIPVGTRHHMDFEEPITIDRLKPEERTVEALTARINDAISRRIAARPELWLWMHDRWKATGESGNADAE
jgi:KDO2-lipid IV(A) lauroyltransferase